MAVEAGVSLKVKLAVGPPAAALLLDAPDVQLEVSTQACGSAHARPY